MNQKIAEIEAAYQRTFSTLEDNPLNESASITLISLSYLKNTLQYIKGNLDDEESVQKSTLDDVLYFAEKR